MDTTKQPGPAGGWCLPANDRRRVTNQCIPLIKSSSTTEYREAPEKPASPPILLPFAGLIPAAPPPPPPPNCGQARWSRWPLGAAGHVRPPPTIRATPAGPALSPSGWTMHTFTFRSYVHILFSSMIPDPNSLPARPKSLLSRERSGQWMGTRD